MIFQVFLLVVGFTILVKGADYLVSGSSAIAKKFNISELVIGLTIVAFGTSMPELVVNVVASLQGASQLAIGNILGSNVSNILLVLGVTAVIYPLTVKKTTIIGEIPFALFAVFILALLLNDSIFGFSSRVSGLDLADGLILLIFFAIFIYYTFTISQPDKRHTPNFIKKFLSLNEKLDHTKFGGDQFKEMTYRMSAILIIIGLAGLTLGGKLIVDSAVYIASFFGMSEFAIGVTVVAIGTSLPELVTSVVAATKKKSDIAIGNIVGSNIFNILWILGISALIRPVIFDFRNNIDLTFNFGATLLLLIGLFFSKSHTLGRIWGVVFIALYIIYIFIQFV